MLKSKTRRRVAVKTAAIAAACGGIFFGAVPAIASMAAGPKPVAYTCTPTAGTPAGASHTFQMELVGPAVAPTPNSTVVVTWKIGTPVPALTAPSAITSGDRLSVDAEAVITGSPLASPMETRAATATATSGAVVPGGPMTVFPTVLVTVMPTATGVFGVRPDAFTLAHVPAAGTGTGTGLYDCTADQAQASAAALLVTVQPSGSSSVSASPTPTETPTPTPTETATTPAPTITITQTKTAKPTKTRQIDETPGGGASTGGGGDAGPDARVIMLSGLLMVAGATAGGLVLRRRTATRG
ncbi:hypothetical protein [Streptosporangium sp. NPDC087985]|uniref:hypothetical protein n=1 Tax=Streptosporangium sp. NPDC087985 TaxID=3366196 RepID=UPI0037F6D1BF